MSFKKPFRAVRIKLGEHYRWKQRRQRIHSLLLPVAFLAGAAVLGGGVGALSASEQTQRRLGNSPISGCRVVDGDTLRCGGERVRLLGIDAPELPGHCNPGRACAPGDPFASTRSLQAALVGNLSIQRVGQDRYGRTLALVSGSRGDLSCWQLTRQQARYRDDWDDGGRLARICPAAGN